MKGAYSLPDGGQGGCVDDFRVPLGRRKRETLRGNGEKYKFCLFYNDNTQHKATGSSR